MGNDTEISDINKKLTELIERAAQEDSSWLNILICLLMVVVFLVSLAGNLMTCIVIYYDKSMHTLTNYYLFNLAVSDILVTLAVPLFVHEQTNPNFFLKHPSFADTVCKIQIFFLMVLWNNCILLMTALAVERYVAICRPMVQQSTSVRRRVIKVTGIIWIIAIAETVPETWDVRVIQSKSTSVCLNPLNHFYRIVNGVLAVLTFILPLGIMIFVYAMIAFQINVVQKNTRMTKGRTFNKRNNRSKVNKLIVALTAAFLVCWLPFFAIRIYTVVLDEEQLTKVDKWWFFVWKISGIMSWSSAVLNPLLFSVMSTKFQRSLKALWNKIVRG